MHSTSNLDLLAGEELDLVICNPTSSLHASRARTLGERVRRGGSAEPNRDVSGALRRVIRLVDPDAVNSSVVNCPG